jgi:hypothetical protein
MLLRKPVEHDACRAGPTANSLNNSPFLKQQIGSPLRPFFFRLLAFGFATILLS